MPIFHLDTFAAMKLIIEEKESEVRVDELAGNEDRRLVSSWLLHIDMHCAAGRHPNDVDLDAVRAALDVLDLVDGPAATSSLPGRTLRFSPRPPSISLWH